MTFVCVVLCIMGRPSEFVVGNSPRCVDDELDVFRFLLQVTHCFAVMVVICRTEPGRINGHVGTEIGQPHVLVVTTHHRIDT